MNGEPLLRLVLRLVINYLFILALFSSSGSKSHKKPWTWGICPWYPNLSHGYARGGDGVAASDAPDERWNQPIYFMGNHQSRIDAKGRMSIPAPFRASLKAEDGSVALVLRPSHVHPCIEAWPVPRFAAFAAKFDQMESFSADQDDLATTLYSDAWPVEADKEGRIVMPESLVRHAALTEAATFMGLGDRFQIWEPMAANDRRAAARASAASRGLTLPGVKA